MRKPHHHNDEEKNNNPTSESEFSFTIARVAVAQICQSMGFMAAQAPALEALTDIATRYLEEIAKVAAAAANSAGRTESNIADVVAALEDLAAVRGVVGSSEVRSPPCAYASAVIGDLIRFVRYADEIPFAQPVPGRGRRRRLLKYGGECGNDGKWYGDGGGLQHMPRWLPAVPEVAEERGVKRKEVKWGCLDGVVGRGENGGCLDAGELREGNCGIEALGKRGKVRFKMGIGIRNHGIVGNLSGVGNGKRVRCEL